jgi:hypothetical protein
MVKKPVYSSSLFTKKKFAKPEPIIEDDDSEIEQMPQPRVGFSTKPLTVETTPLQPSQAQPPQQIPQQPIQSGLQQKPKPADEDEDLEIPAFIRKKMGM